MGGPKVLTRERSYMADFAFDTYVVHGGERLPESSGQPTTTPLYTTSTYLYKNAEQMDAVFGGQQVGYVYSRYGNPTLTALESVLTKLEHGAAAVVFGSGMAALHAALLLCELQPSDVVLAARDIYGASLGLLTKILGPLGIETRLADFTNLDNLGERLRETPHPRVALFEPISNPLAKVADVLRVAEIAHTVGARVITDSTFTPPYLLQPLTMGVDIVVHSATKYLGGHGDATAGAVIVKDEAVATNLRMISKLVGGILSPFEAHLIHRGIKTLSVRMERHGANALRVAERLAHHPQVERVYFPGLAGHPQHELSRRQFRNGQFGAMMAFEIKDADRDKVFRFLNALKLVLPATTLGDVYTEVSYPPMSSHRDWSPGERRQAGITDGLIRLSVGIEHYEDILADLEQALTAAHGNSNHGADGSPVQRSPF